jgi:membrane fusion protein (multidrug efflux system)
VVDSANKVAIRTVKPGLRSGAMWIIDEGLEPDELVVAEGVQKVRAGMEVKPKPYVLASAGDGR